MGIVVFVAVIQVDDAITEAMTSKLVGLVVHVDDAHRRAWSLRHQLTRAVTPAPPLPEATSFIQLGCFALGSGGPQIQADIPTELSDDCKQIVTGDEGSLQASASMQTRFTCSRPDALSTHVGTLTLEAHGSASLPTSLLETYSNSGGYETFYFALKQTRAVPFDGPVALPVLFHAVGEGQVSSTNSFSTSSADGAVTVEFVEGFPLERFDFTIQAIGGIEQATFDEEVPLDLVPFDPSAPEPWYRVGLAAHCSTATVVEVVAPVSEGSETTYIAGKADCRVTLDPTFRFDQTTFDRRMGGDTFALADHYEFVLSPNIAACASAPDAGPGGEDAGTSADAGTSPDAGMPDASAPSKGGSSDDGGCTIGRGDEQSSGAQLLTLIAAALWLVRRRSGWTRTLRVK